MSIDESEIKNIFLADDDADDRMFFQDALKQILMPTRLILSKDGLELMDNLETINEPPPPHVIFLDLNMPRKNGFQCLQEIRDTPRLKNIPIVIFTTTNSDDAVDETYRQGANYYICKPMSFPLLVKAIQTVLSLKMWNLPQPHKENFFLAIN